MVTHHRKARLRALLMGVVLVASALASGPAAAENIKIGAVKISAYGPVYIAAEKGYFAAEGLTPEIVFFEAASPISVAVVSGDIDFGTSGTSGSFFSLAGQGELRIIGAGAHEAPHFQFFTMTLSNRSFAAGLKSYKDLAGHSVAVSQIGSPSHYSLALIEEKYGIESKSIRVLPLQAIPNQLSAVIGGQADATVLPATAVLPTIQRGDAKLLGFIGDEVPWQVGIVYASTKTITQRHDTVERFLRAYRKGARDYHDAFTGPDGQRLDGPTAPEILAILAKYTGQPVARIESGIAYMDAEARLDEKDILHQVDWFRSQGMVKVKVDPDALIDRRDAKPLAAP